MTTAGHERGSLIVGIEAIATIGPGLPDWTTTASVLRGEQPWSHQPPVVPPAARLPAAERRRIGPWVRLSLAVADQLFAAADHAGHGMAPANVATVFSGSSGDGDNCDALCTALSADEPLISPTRFTNSVHNAPAGYWSIAVGSREPSTSLCAFDGSFAAGLQEAALQVVASGRPVALISSEAAYPEPIRGVRPITESFAVAMLLVPSPRGRIARLRLDPLTESEASRLDDPGLTPGPASGASSGLALGLDPGLETLRATVPAARSLPLLRAIAREETDGDPLLLDANRPLVLPVRVLTKGTD